MIRWTDPDKQQRFAMYVAGPDAPEKWRLVPSLEPYEVSDFGRVRRAGRLLLGFFDSDGYHRISTSIAGARRQVSVHTMVLFAFVGPRPTPEHQCAHWDGDRIHNRLGNLRWALPPEQYEDRIRHRTDNGGPRNYWAKLTQEQANEIRQVYTPGHPAHGMMALSRRFGVTRGAISGIVHKGGWAP